MVYKKKFWRPDATGIVVLHTEKRPLLEISDRLRQYLTAERVDLNMVQEIAQSLYHYDVLPSTDIPVLVCWFSGPAALMIENLSTELVGQICHEVLCRYLDVAHTNYQPVQLLKCDTDVLTRRLLIIIVFVLSRMPFVRTKMSDVSLCVFAITNCRLMVERLFFSRK